MTNTIAHILIACLLALSLHEFGTDEHLVKVAADEMVLADSDSGKDQNNSPAPQMGAACDICQVVHQYVVADQNTLDAPPANRARLARTWQHPPGNIPNDILRPPTA